MKTKYELLMPYWKSENDGNESSRAVAHCGIIEADSVGAAKSAFKKHHAELGMKVRFSGTMGYFVAEVK